MMEITPANDGLDVAELPKIAATVGLDVAAFNECLSSGEMKSVVDAQAASGAKAGVNGTPHSIVLVDGKVAGTIGGAQQYEIVKASIEKTLQSK